MESWLFVLGDERYCYPPRLPLYTNVLLCLSQLKCIIRGHGLPIVGLGLFDLPSDSGIVAANEIDK